MVQNEGYAEKNARNRNIDFLSLHSNRDNQHHDDHLSLSLNPQHYVSCYFLIII